jgi:hypothetical protein
MHVPIRGNMIQDPFEQVAGSPCSPHASHKANGMSNARCTNACPKSYTHETHKRPRPCPFDAYAQTNTRQCWTKNQCNTPINSSHLCIVRCCGSCCSECGCGVLVVVLRSDQCANEARQTSEAFNAAAAAAPHACTLPSTQCMATRWRCRLDLRKQSS